MSISQHGTEATGCRLRKGIEMDETTPIKRTGRTRRWIASAALVGAGLAAGGVLAGSQLAQAADTSSSSNGHHAGMMAPADMVHGPGEKLLRGTTADKVEAAALDAVPGGTIIRVETDSDGSTYEAHIQKADGSTVTVKVDANFNVTDTIHGFGGAPRA